MSRKETDELIRGSGDVFADLGFSDAPVMRLKSRVATQIQGTLDRRGLSVRAAATQAGATAADLSRIRNANLDRFTLDRLVRIAERLGCRVEIRISKAKAA
jgi:predicted XRE-type DNA-binding protein